MRSLIAIAMVIAIAGPARANTTVFGVGVSGCGEVVAAIVGERNEWARLRQTQVPNGVYTIPYAVFISFLQGLMTAQNLASQTMQPFTDRDLLSRMAFIEQHCLRTPLDNFLRAIAALRDAEARLP